MLCWTSSKMEASDWSKIVCYTYLASTTILFKRKKRNVKISCPILLSLPHTRALTGPPGAGHAGRAGAGGARDQPPAGGPQRDGALPGRRQGHPRHRQLEDQVRERSSLYNLPTAGPRTLAELSLEGATLATFTHPDMVEPVAVAVAPRGEFVVADNVSGLLVFDPCGKLLRHGHGVEVTVPP